MAELHYGDKVEIFKFKETGVAELVAETAQYLSKHYSGTDRPKITWGSDSKVHEGNYVFVIHDAPYPERRRRN